MRARVSLGFALSCALLVAGGAVAQHDDAVRAADAFMGDWTGVLRAADGTETELFAQVIYWGAGAYQANLVSSLETRAEPLAVLQGRSADGGVSFGDAARIEGDQFSGALVGPVSGNFALAPVSRPSPTLGAAPPPGAVVLFDGSGLGEWVLAGEQPWTVNLASALGGDERAAYLRCNVWSPAAQPARLEVGSDDALKAWVNGELVHSMMAMRALTDFEDLVDIELEEGWNAILLKVVQGGGGWAAGARVRGPEGTDLEGLRFDPMPVLEPGTDLRSLQGESSGTIIAWQVAGPYFAEGLDATALFDQAFDPEPGTGADVEWRVINDRPKPIAQWRLTGDGAMEVTPGSGSMVSRRAFADHQLHLEFRTPFEPDARGQGRGNSGVYIQAWHEIQILDSYGLAGDINECGALYAVAKPLVNACAPPLQWQTFDVDYTTARYDDATGKVSPPHITVRHNGLLVHDSVELPAPGGGPGLVAEGPILLQDHWNPVQFRNIWVVEK